MRSFISTLLPRQALHWLGVCTLAAVFTLLSNPVVGQGKATNALIEMRGNSVRVPFSYENGFVVVELRFNGIWPLRFIIDTGAEYTILTQREIAEILGLESEREFTLIGADMQTLIKASLIRNISFHFDQLILRHRDILVTEEDYFRINYFTGTPVHGILGADILSQFTVELDYRREMLTFWDPAAFQPDPDYVAIPLELRNHKPYLSLPSRIHENTPPVRLKYLIDTGAALSLLLLTSSHPSVTLPEQVVQGILGVGLGGFLTGVKGRIQQVQMGSFPLNNLVASFQDINRYPDTTHLHGRHGLIGNEVLQRFDLAFDYPRETLYLRPNRDYADPFPIDRSGLFLIATGAHLNTYIVQEVIPGSPAFLADLRPGDILKSYNYWPIGFYSLADLNRRFRKDPGKRIRLKIKRGRKTLRRHFVLADYF